ncbi:MAG: M48 family metalloprotease, partial [Patescibacteria group bacterium]
MSMDSSPTLERYSMGSVAQTEKDATKSRDNLGLAAKLTQTSEQVESRVKMGDEYRFNPAVKIDVREKIIIEVKDISNQTQTKDLTESVKREFQYLSSTQGLEINTDRTNILQDYVDKMIGSNQDWEGKVRVVIMNRGKEPRAFAYPDGTICISQSLINLYDSLDEVMAVLAHEVGHLINGTTKAAFRANVYKRNSLGVKWLHETTSDFISCELLEKLGLKSTAQADVLSKLAKHSGNNNRGIEHQAPVLRATETLGVHAIKDFETSHLEYTPLPAELSKEVTKTNFELILAATGENDFEAIEEYLPNLHPRDFGEYFDLAMTGNFWRIESQLGLTSLKKETIDGVVKRVKLLTSKRLMEEGLSEKEIKLFFFSVLSDSNVLYPKFKDFAELEDHVAVARKISQENLVNKMIDKLFDKPNFYGMDPLILLVSLVENDFSKLTDEDLHSLIDISEFTPFVLAVHQQIAAELPNIDGVDFVDENGKVLDVTSYNSIYDVESGRITIPILIQNNLEKMIFNYIYNYYLPQIESYGLELDQSQIEDIFQFLKEKGFIIMGNRSYFPYYYDKSVKLIDEKYLTVIEKAYQNVFGERLVKEAEKTEVLSLPSLEQFRQSIEGRGVLQILEIFNKNEIISQKVDEKMATNYTQVVLDYLDQRDYFNSRLNALLMMGENYYGSALDEETCNQIIEKKGLNKEALYQEARQRAELDRFADKVYFLSRSIAPFENKFFDFVESITEQFPYDLNDYDHFQLVVMCKPMLEMIEGDRFHMAGKITNLDRFSELKIVQETMNKLKSPHFESLADLQLYIKDILNIYKQSSSATPPGLNEKIALYEDNIFSVLLMKPVRDELLRLSRPENVSKKDFPVLIDLINSYFPYSPQKTGLIREIQKSFLSDKQIPIQEKIDLFFEKYRLFGYEGAVLVAEQITDLDTYRFFRERLNALGQDYISGNKDLSLVAGVDIISSMLNMKADSLIKTVSNDQKIARETSTDLAMYWVDLCFNQANEHVKYDADTGKIILSDEGRTKFITLKDCFDDLKALSDGKKTLIALKALSDQNGLLVTEGGRKLLEKMMLNGLDLESDFFRIVLSQAVKNGDAKVLGLPASQMLAPFLFRSLNVDAVNLFRLRNHDMYTRSTNLDEDIWEKIKTKDYSADLPKILSSGTRDIRFFGYKYYHQPDSAISLQAQEAGQTYFDTLENLQKLVIEEEKDLNQEQHGYISPSTEAIIKAGETSPIFVRSMQMAVQIKNFSPAVQERLSHTQDSMQGMEKLRFWDNLLSKAENDPQLADFLENDLISLDSYLGGGSLFTTYGATIRGKDGNQQKIVIKMSNPNAEEFIHMSYDFSSEVLAQAEQESGGKTKQDIKFAN